MKPYFISQLRKLVHACERFFDNGSVVALARIFMFRWLFDKVYLTGLAAIASILPLLTYCELRDQNSLLREQLNSNREDARLAAEREALDILSADPTTVTANLKEFAVRRLISGQSYYRVADILIAGAEISNRLTELVIERSSFHDISVRVTDTLRINSSDLDKVTFDSVAEYKGSIKLRHVTGSDINFSGEIFVLEIYESVIDVGEASDIVICEGFVFSTHLKNSSFENSILGAQFKHDVKMIEWIVPMYEVCNLNFQNVKFENVSFRGAKLIGVEFSNVEGLAQADFEGACVGPNTTLPPDILISRSCEF